MNSFYGGNKEKKCLLKHEGFFVAKATRSCVNYPSGNALLLYHVCFVYLALNKIIRKAIRNKFYPGHTVKKNGSFHFGICLFLIS